MPPLNASAIVLTPACKHRNRPSPLRGCKGNSFFHFRKIFLKIFFPHTPQPEKPCPMPQKTARIPLFAECKGRKQQRISKPKTTKKQAHPATTWISGDFFSRKPATAFPPPPRHPSHAHQTNISLRDHPPTFFWPSSGQLLPHIGARSCPDHAPSGKIPVPTRSNHGRATVNPR